MEDVKKYSKTAKINWYRCKVDPEVMSKLMQCSDLEGFKQALGHLGLWCVTGTLAYLAFENITPQVAEAIRKSGVMEGIVLCNTMHITASVFINDNETGLHEDYKKWLEGLAPFDASPQRYQHTRTGEDNADAHMKRQIMGREVVVAITRGKLDFGPWEQIFYGEFDGRRNKRVLVKVIGE